MSNNARGVLPRLLPDKDVPSAEESDASGLLPVASTSEQADLADSFVERIWASVSKRTLISPQSEVGGKSG